MKKFVSVVALYSFSIFAMAETVYSVDETTIETLLSDPEAKAILEKYIPETISSPQLSMAKGYTLTYVAGFSPDDGELSEENLKKIDEELSTLGD